MYMCHLLLCVVVRRCGVSQRLSGWGSCPFLPRTQLWFLFLTWFKKLPSAILRGRFTFSMYSCYLQSTYTSFPVCGLCWTCCSMGKVGILHISGLCSMLEHRMADTSCYLAFHCEGRWYGMSFRVCCEDKAIESVGSVGTLLVHEIDS